MQRSLEDEQRRRQIMAESLQFPGQDRSSLEQAVRQLREEVRLLREARIIQQETPQQDVVQTAAVGGNVNRRVPVLSVLSSTSESEVA